MSQQAKEIEESVISKMTAKVRIERNKSSLQNNEEGGSDEDAVKKCLEEGEANRARDLSKALQFENRDLQKQVKTLSRKLLKKNEEGKGSDQASSSSGK